MTTAPSQRNSASGYRRSLAAHSCGGSAGISPLGKHRLPLNQQKDAITMVGSEPAGFGLLWIRTPGDPSFRKSRHILVGCQRRADDGERDGGTGCFAEPHIQIQ